jgi:2-aminoadipate transaminase
MDFSSRFAKRTNRMKASEVRELLRYASKDLISFGGGLPDPLCLPSEEETKAATEYISSVREKAFQYGLTGGLTELKDELSKYCTEKLDIKASPEEVMIVSGSQQALDMTARILINQRDRVLIELPTYLAAVQAFNLARPNYLGIPMDNDGMNMEYLENNLVKLKEKGLKPKLIYTIPTCQNPAGLSMSMDRRRHLLELASKYDFIIVEDDPYSRIMFKEVNFKRLKSLDKDGRVIYISTFSKIYAPGVRVGWIVADRSVLNFYELAKQLMDLCTSSLVQYFVLHALREGIIEKKLPFIQERYRKKCFLMKNLLYQNMPEGSRWSDPVGGMFIFGWLDGRIDTKKILLDVIQKYNVTYVPGASFFIDGSGGNTMRLNFSYPSEGQIEIGIKRLSEAINGEMEHL